MGISFRIQAVMHTRCRAGANSLEAPGIFFLFFPDFMDVVKVITEFMKWFFFLFTEFMRVSFPE
jgi:hypothetical protein